MSRKNTFVALATTTALVVLVRPGRITSRRTTSTRVRPCSLDGVKTA
jgi:hypothetical protein